METFKGRKPLKKKCSGLWDNLTKVTGTKKKKKNCKDLKSKCQEND